MVTFMNIFNNIAAIYLKVGVVEEVNFHQFFNDCNVAEFYNRKKNTHK